VAIGESRDAGGGAGGSARISRAGMPGAVAASARVAQSLRPLHAADVAASVTPAPSPRRPGSGGRGALSPAADVRRFVAPIGCDAPVASRPPAASTIAGGAAAPPFAPPFPAPPRSAVQRWWRRRLRSRHACLGRPLLPRPPRRRSIFCLPRHHRVLRRPWRPWRRPPRFRRPLPRVLPPTGSLPHASDARHRD